MGSFGFSAPENRIFWITYDDISISSEQQFKQIKKFYGNSLGYNVCANNNLFILYRLKNRETNCDLAQN